MAAQWADLLPHVVDFVALANLAFQPVKQLGLAGQQLAAERLGLAAALLDGARGLLDGEAGGAHRDLRLLFLALLDLENLLERGRHQTSFPSCSIVLS